MRGGARGGGLWRPHRGRACAAGARLGLRGVAGAPGRGAGVTPPPPPSPSDALHLRGVRSSRPLSARNPALGTAGLRFWSRRARCPEVAQPVRPLRRLLYAPRNLDSVVPWVTGLLMHELSPANLSR
ncbi:hypothetical protein VULLAG_LOCUS4634 [Vulpes lagopus]